VTFKFKLRSLASFDEQANLEDFEGWTRSCFFFVVGFHGDSEWSDKLAKLLIPGKLAGAQVANARASMGENPRSNSDRG
jgi:hypothetical protein